MTSARGSSRAPQIDGLRFGPLAEGAVAELTADADLESVRYADLTLPRLDLPDALVESTQFVGVTAEEADLTGARLSEVELERVLLPVVHATRSQWRDVKVSGRLGSIEAYDAQWRSVHFVGCKLSYLNLRGAELVDVAFTDCTIEELDLANARLRRVAFPGTRVEHLNVQHSELRDVDLRGAQLSAIDGIMDLRGAVISPEQLTLLAPVLADALGLTVEP
jgi:uncharacterized protein YjbI with pentapeptide repeats